MKVKVYDEEVTIEKAIDKVLSKTYLKGYLDYNKLIIIY